MVVKKAGTGLYFQRRNLWDLGLGEEFVEMSPKALSIKKSDKLYFIKIKIICSVKDLVKRMKRQVQTKNICKPHR